MGERKPVKIWGPWSEAELNRGCGALPALLLGTPGVGGACEGTPTHLLPGERGAGPSLTGCPS